MKTVLNLLVQILLVVGLLACLQCTPQKDKEESKEIAEAHNDDKFESPEGEQDAQFVVDAVDDSYTILGLAEMGQQRGGDKVAQEAGKVIEAQTKVLNKLKTYAASEVISIPQGSEKIRENHQELYDEEKKFEEKWCREVMNRNEKMIRDFETYAAKTSGNLKIVIDEALPTLRAQQDKLMAYQESVEE
jgi:predicted outer membrane protein